MIQCDALAIGKWKEMSQELTLQLKIEGCFWEDFWGRCLVERERPIREREGGCFDKEQKKKMKK